MERKPSDSSGRQPRPARPRERGREDERISISSFEQGPGSGRGGRDYSTARSRKHKRREEQGRGKLLWVAIAGVVGVYILLLGVHTVTSRGHVAPPPPVEERIPDGAEADESTAPPADEGMTAMAPPVFAVSNLIADISRAQQLTRDGQKQAASRRYSVARDQLETAVTLAPHMHEALIALARVLQEQKDDLRARDMLLRAVSVDPDHLESRIMLAQTLLRLREYENALATALWVLDLRPYSEQAHQIAADVYTATDRHREAIFHWEKITALNGSNFAAKNNLGTALLNEGQLNQAIAAFESVLRDNPGNSQAYYYMAICFVRKDEPDLAVGVLSTAATHFGIQFVKAWVKGPEFDELRELPSFQRQFSDDGQPITPGT